jgi:hypothetical protein
MSQPLGIRKVGNRLFSQDIDDDMTSYRKPASAKAALAILTAS